MTSPALRYCPDLYNYQRRETRPVMVGKVQIGGGAPIVVQSMLTSDTRDAEACMKEALGLAEAGCQIVRVTAQTRVIAENLQHIRDGIRAAGCDVPLVADIHFKPDAAMEAYEVALAHDGAHINAHINVAAQEADPDSVLNYYRRLIGLRKAERVLVEGAYHPLMASHRQIYAYCRGEGAGRLVVIVNLSKQPARYCHAGLMLAHEGLLLANLPVAPHAPRDTLQLQPYEARVYRVAVR